MTNFEILIDTSFSQISHFRRVKNSQVFVTPVKNSFEFGLVLAQLDIEALTGKFHSKPPNSF